MKWRRSDHAAQTQTAAPGARGNGQVVARQAIEQPAVRPQASTNGLRPATVAPQLKRIQRVAWQADHESLLPPPSTDPAPRAEPDFFSDPFGDDPQPAEHAAIQDPPAASEDLIPPAGELDPAANGLPNALRPAAPAEESGFSDPTLQPQAIPLPPDPIAPPAGKPLGEAPIEERIPEEEKLIPAEDGAVEADQELPAPAAPSRSGLRDLLESTDEDPFGFQDSDRRQRDRQDRERLESGDVYDADQPRFDPRMDEEDLSRVSDFSCNDFRQRIAAQTIEQVSLDISPPFRPDEIDLEKYHELKAEFDQQQAIRQWRSIDGSPMAFGRLRDLAYEKAVIETDTGATQQLSLSQLSEADLAYIADNWGLPAECLLEQVTPTPRHWVMTTVTWKASNLCYTPLYFEDVNLERYGHTHGPLLEPLVQSAHFFGNVLVLPYKMGVHSPHECVYPLGYYRPGNCAPWIKQPVPISAKGAITQAVTTTGLFWLIP